VTTTAERFTLQLPSDPAFISTARMFACSLARHFEMEEETVEDLTLAISEACTRALAAESTNSSMFLRVASHDGRLVFEVQQGDLRTPAETETPTPSHEAMAAGLSLELITALFQDATVATDEQGQSVLRFSIP
jgi:anti-sigma regulatory factor (Ser/Thr protein kinase)